MSKPKSYAVFHSVTGQKLEQIGGCTNANEAVSAVARWHNIPSSALEAHEARWDKATKQWVLL